MRFTSLQEVQNRNTFFSFILVSIFLSSDQILPLKQTHTHPVWASPHLILNRRPIPGVRTNN
jgi:hypothetical protein